MSFLSVVGVLATLAVLTSGYTFHNYNTNNNRWNQDYNNNNFRYQPRTLREGQQCTEEGFFRDSEDCQKFYRCAMLPDAIGNKITRYEFRCPGGTVFDEQIATCNYANQMENPPQNCRAEDPAPAQQLPQVPAIPGQGQGGSGGSQQPGNNQQLPQVPSQQQPQVPGVQQPNPQQPQVPGVQQPNPQQPMQPQQPQLPGFPSNQQPGGQPQQPDSGSGQGQFPGSGSFQPSNPSGSGSNPQQPGSQSQVPNFPVSQPGGGSGSGGNQQIPGGFPSQPPQRQPQVFYLPNSGQMWYYVPQHSQQQQMQMQNRPPITFGLL